MRTAVNILAVLLVLSLAGNVIAVRQAVRRAELQATAQADADLARRQAADAQRVFDERLEERNRVIDTLTSQLERLPSIHVNDERHAILDRPVPADAAGKRARILRAIGR